MKEAGKDPNRPQPIRKDSSLVGRRMWYLGRDHERWRLTNIANQTSEYWPRGVYEADCTNWRQHRDRGPSPQNGCGCGMYGFWNMEELARQYHAGALTGVVYAWGRCHPGREGFKAQYMLPIAVDWPVCMGDATVPTYGYGPSWMKKSLNAPDYNSVVCQNPVEYLLAEPQYLGDYPTMQEEAEEGPGWEWVDLKLTPRWYCIEHTNYHQGGYENHRERFRVEAWRVLHDLEIYYELEVFPPLDFPVLSTEPLEKVD